MKEAEEAFWAGLDETRANRRSKAQIEDAVEESGQDGIMENGGGDEAPADENNE